ncbi:hypothetical protein CGRA01v4_14353 [Colletotrichum graminicola]|uniref:Uncharacterized protein n=1 Tax=Colletotrichum graminicola (strain M1.001 / M2 / FGSC 10212) TaxID=645133 RepID=E3Q5H6_COLGM|nr:uncharacterized protein GLRG_01087 [Colletotrichum graminicola M1.001]EFQ25943.1 hypothetical protein GLRG_01087 [Colletotrichum graminicola M1.001]WDK23062.1 hypothetical protein CGRA01v4_14353 [Colletotrichum graminicola]
MSAPESYQLESLASDADGAKPSSPAVQINPADVRWLNRGGRRCEACKIVARLLSMMLCAVVLIISMAWWARPELDRYGVWMWLGLPGALPPCLWDLGEFLSLCARRGRGITPKAHIGVELILFLMTYMAGVWLPVQIRLQETGPSGQLRGKALTLATVQYVLMLLIATIHLALFIRACVERRREIRQRRPRVMYIPETGQTVYVVAKPFPEPPPPPPPPPPQQQQQQQPARAPSLPQSLDGPVGSSPLRNAFQQQQELLQLEIPPPPPSSMIKRKPVPWVPRNAPAGDRDRFLRPSMRPPPEDYVPSGEELERRKRGDAQPQLVMPGDVDIKFATSVTGMTPADAGVREGKYRMDVPVHMSATPTGEPSGSGGGRTRSL